MAWFGGKIDLNSLKNQVANTLKDVLDEEEDDPSSQGRGNELEDEILALKASNASLHQEKETESRQLKELLIEKEEEIRQLQGWAPMDTEEKDASHLVAKIQGLEARLKEVLGKERRDSRSSEEIQNYKDTIQRLNSELQEKSLEEDRKAKELKEHHDTIQSLQSQLDLKESTDSKTLQEELRDKITFAEGLQRDLRRQKNEFNQSTEDAMRERDERESVLRAELAKYENAVKVQAEEIREEFSSYKESQASRMKELEDAHSALLKEKDDSIEKLRSVKDMEPKDSELESLLKRNTELQEALNEQEREKGSIEDKLLDLSSTLLKKNDELLEKELCLKEYQNEKESVISDLREQIVCAQSEVDVLQENKKSFFSEEMEALQSKIKLLQEENSGLQSSLADSERVLQEMKSETNLSLSDASSSNRDDYENVKNMLFTKEKLVSSLEKELSIASAWKEDTISVLGVSSDNEFTSLLEEILCSLREALEHSNGEEFSNAQNLSVEKILKHFNSEFQSSQEREKSYILHQNELKIELESLKKELADSRSTIEALESSKEDLEGELEKVISLNASDKLASCEKELCSFKEQNMKLETEVQSLEKTVLELKPYEASVVSLSESLQSLKNKNEELMRKCSEDKDKLNILTEEMVTFKATAKSSTVDLEQRNADANKVIQKLSALVNEKDQEIDSLRLKVEAAVKKGSSSNESSELKNKVNSMLKERQEMIDTIQLKHSESVGYHEEVERLRQVLEVKESEISALKDKVAVRDSSLIKNNKEDNSLMPSNMNNNMESSNKEVPDLKDELNSTIQELTRVREERDACVEAKNSLQLAIKDKEYDLAMAKKNMHHMEGLLKEREDACEALNKEASQLKASLDETKRETASLKQEKDDARALSSGKDRELMELRREVNNLIDKKRRLEQESERLKNHLVAVEDGYTRDAIEYKDREEDLRTKLLSTEEALRISSVQHSTAVQEATQLGGSLGTQVTRLKEERDEALKKYNKLNKDYKDQAKAVDNLQMALDGFRREQENEIRFSQQYLQDKLKSQQDKIESREAEIGQLRSELAASHESAAQKQSLLEQLEHKSHIISTLKQEINSREELLKSAKSELSAVNQNQSVRVDKNLIKNLVVGYAAADDGKKSEILKIIGTVLDFTPDERKKSGLDGDRWSWFRGSQQNASSGIDQSLASAFVKFLETESSSEGNVLVLPTEPRPSQTTPAPAGHKRSSSNSSVSSDRSSPNLLLNNPSNVIPTFSINRSSSSILKHVLIEEKEKQ